MIRTILSYLVLILIPAVSLAIAVVPYLFIKKKYSTSVIASRAERGVAISDDARNEIASRTRNDKIGLVAVPLHYLWGAFFLGLVGNIIWSALIINRPAKISDYIFQTDYSGMLFAWLFYAVFIAITPFLFFKFKYRKLQIKQIVYCVILSLLIASLEIGAGIILFFIGWNRLFYAFN